MLFIFIFSWINHSSSKRELYLNVFLRSRGAQNNLYSQSRDNDKPLNGRYRLIWRYSRTCSRATQFNRITKSPRPTGGVSRRGENKSMAVDAKVQSENKKEKGQKEWDGTALRVVCMLSFGFGLPTARTFLITNFQTPPNSMAARRHIG